MRLKMNLELFENRGKKEEARRRRIASRALAQIEGLAKSGYPMAMWFDQHAGALERQVSESWPQAYGRLFGGLSLTQLRDWLRKTMVEGIYHGTEEKPSEGTLSKYFTGLAILLAETERELASAGQ